jgi:hypothetical protein
MDVRINTEDEMLDYVNKKYLVLYPDKTIKLYSSLREIEKDTLISSSSISKKISSMRYGNDWCICVSKGTKYIFYIKKLDTSSSIINDVILEKNKSNNIVSLTPTQLS